MIAPTDIEAHAATAAGAYRRELEICAETLQACEAARAGGADRIELCSALGEGGVTPSHGLLRAALAASKHPIHILLRPRGGNFVYSEAEFAVMRDDLQHAASIGVAGFVAGCLTAGGEVDEDRMGTLVKLAGNLPITFHRAFDHAADLDAAFDKVLACGCQRVLTSGGKPDVTQGMARLADLCSRAAGRLRIAAGGGVTLANAPELCRIPRLDLHASLRTQSEAALSEDPLWQRPSVNGTDVSPGAVHALATLVHKSLALPAAHTGAAGGITGS